MPKFSLSDREGGVFGSIKSKLGFGGDSEDGRSSRRSRSDDYDDYGDYDDYDYDDYDYNDYDDGADADAGARDWNREDSRSSRSGRYGDYDGYRNDYEVDYQDDISTTAYRPLEGSYGARRGADFPQLVTMNDVKMSTPLPEIHPSEPAEDEGTTYMPSAIAASEQGRYRSEGLDSLFGSTAAGSARTLKVIKPVSYADAEGVAKGIKAGAVVVLALRNTPDALRGRILDFSFGAASALDANVECPGDKVYAIARGRALDDAEKQQLRNQGVL